MKYSYAYKTGDGIRHESAIEAASRDEAFAQLRRQGIRPIKVVAADGAKANGEIRGVRKRVVAAIVAIAVLAVVGVIVNSQRTLKIKGRELAQASQGAASSAPRHQIYGDPVIMEDLEHGKFGAILPRSGDQYLAWFAQPGKLMTPKGVTELQLRNFDNAKLSELKAVLESDVAISEGDSREARELKQIVNGMRAELREYLANGNGTIRSYTRRLFERLQQEIQIYELTKIELEREKSAEVWDRKNDALRRIGLRTIPNPKEEE